MSDKKKIVIALGGNALGNNLPEQMACIKKTACSIADLTEAGNDVIITHGNGPQVGMIQDAMSELTKIDPEKYLPCPLSVCVAMSQSFIGYDLQNLIREELLNRGIDKNVATVLTQVEVSIDDPAFDKPTKPIGPYLSREDAERLERECGYTTVNIPGFGYRRTVASPKPVRIVEGSIIKSLSDDGNIVIACGGGGIPVYRTDRNHLKGAAAVIDKDHASCALAKQLDADLLIILTAVEKVCLNFQKPDQRELDLLTPDEARRCIAEDQFPPGSMLPKIEAAIDFAESKPGRTALITLLEKANEGIMGKTGTIIRM